MAEQVDNNANDQAAQDAHYIEVEASTKADDVPQGEEFADEDGRVEAGFNFKVGASLEEDIEMYGEETVRDMWLRSATVKAQSAIRRELKNGTHPDDIPETLSDWRPDVQHTVQKDPKSSIMSNYKNLSPEEKQELLAELQSQANG